MDFNPLVYFSGKLPLELICQYFLTLKCFTMYMIAIVGWERFSGLKIHDFSAIEVFEEILCIALAVSTHSQLSVFLWNL